MDEETGLYYYNARYYDPELGRFIQPDTVIPDLDNPQSYNRYTYALNNPLKYTDPTGHESYWAGVGNMFLGYFDAGKAIVSGTIHMVAHPIDTAVGVYTAVSHPVDTAVAIKNATVESWNSGSRGQGQVVGNILFAAASVAAPGAQAGNLSKASQVASVGSKLERVEAAASAGSTVEKAAAAVQSGGRGLRVMVNPRAGELGGINISGANAGKVRQISVRHSTRKAAIEEITHSHKGKPRPTPKKTDTAKMKAYEEAQKYKKPEAHPNSAHPERHFHDSNKSQMIKRQKINRHHTFPD